MNNDMIEAFINAHEELPRVEIEALATRAEHRALKRGDYFCRVGQATQEIGILHQGVMRVVVPHKVSGEETILDFIFPGRLVVAFESAVMNEPVGVNIIALTGCELSVWPYAIKDELVERNSAWGRFALGLVEEAFIRKNRWTRALLNDDAAARYEMALKSFPPDFRRIPQYYVAAYLGIRPQSLSRIRRQITRKKV